MQIRLLRHATLVVMLNDLKLLVDPMLSPAGAMDPVANATSQRRIPLVDLPLDDAALEQLLGEIDGVLVTHIHRDHWDARAAALLDKALPILCQPEDAALIRDQGFTQVLPIDGEYGWRGLRIARTGGRHGTGEIGQKMGPVSGFVLRCAAEPSLYIAGDTIWCPEVADALAAHQPAIAVLNAGAAQFLTGDPITMATADVVQVCNAAPGTQLVAVHMGAINHCLLTRDDLREQLRTAGRLDRVTIPHDGEQITT